MVGGGGGILVLGDDFENGALKPLYGQWALWKYHQMSHFC